MRPRDGIRILRSALEDSDVLEVEGMPVTAAARTAFDQARTQTLVEAVVGLDAMARTNAVQLSAVDEYARQRPRWRGVPLARWAIELADSRARSCGESRLRVLWVVDARLPVPQVNPSILGADGALLGIADLLDPDAGLVGEYDGAGHRELEAHTSDNAREEAFEHAGIVVVRATSIDLGRFRRRTVHRLQAGYRRGAVRVRSRDAWTWRPAGV
jgi:hypothetical protein